MQKDDYKLSQKLVRFPELDLVRGVAIWLMIIYHALFNLIQFELRASDLYSFWWGILGKIIMMTFLTLVGISLYLKAQRQGKLGFSTWETAISFFRRATIIGGCALIVTISSWLVAPHQYIRFGILHLISLSIFIFWPLVLKPELGKLAIVIILIATLLKQQFSVTSESWLFLGLPPENFASIDYLPLLPWSAVVVLGILLGSHYYRAYERKFNLPTNISRFIENRRNSSNNFFLGRALDFISWSGQNSLLLYVIHQPILLGLI